MALTKAPKKPATDAVADFINRAPDARAEATKPAAAPEASQNKKPITITFDPALLAQLDAAAKRHGISRSSALAVAVSKWLGIE